MVIPFAPGPDWYAAWLGHRLAGLDDPEACDAASHELHTDAKMLRRTAIASPAGSRWLSVPIAKGEGMRLSDHGNWPHVHLGAFNAIYGRTPYFPFIFDRLQDLYGTVPETLPELNGRMHGLIQEWLDIDAARMACTEPYRRQAQAAARSMITKVNRNLSILDALARFGKDTLFILLGILDEKNSEQ